MEADIVSNLYPLHWGLSSWPPFGKTGASSVALVWLRYSLSFEC